MFGKKDDSEKNKEFDKKIDELADDGGAYDTYDEDMEEITAGLKKGFSAVGKKMSGFMQKLVSLDKKEDGGDSEEEDK